MPARKAVSTPIRATHHAGGPTRRAATGHGPVTAHQLWGSWGAAVATSGYASANTRIAPHWNRSWWPIRALTRSSTLMSGRPISTSLRPDVVTDRLPYAGTARVGAR